MIGATSSTGLPNYRLYNIDLHLVYDTPTHLSNVILQATLTNEAVARNLRFDEDVGDNTFDLSAVVGNDNGKLKWGSSGFEQSARNISIDCTNKTERRLVVDLQSALGSFVPQQSLNLDEYFDLIEYVHPYQKETYYRLGTKARAPPVNTNVVKFMELLKKNDPDRQLVYYQTGVGTYAPPGLLTTMGLSVATTADKGFAWFLYQHVMDGYKFLMQTYQTGDRISILGFSRGAFTARALAGMIHCVGLLPKHNIEHVPFAYEVYKNANDAKPTCSEKTLHTDDSTMTSQTPPPQVEEPAGALLSWNNGTQAKNVNPEDFKQTFCISVAIDFVGVWDTVASVGSLWPTTLPWIDYNPSIRNFRQALALDERRANFIPSVWDHSRTNTGTQTALEVWFKGQHTDIGGGAVPKREPSKPGQSMLSNISLRWMVRQCFAIDAGIIFDHRVLKKYRDAKVLEPRPPRGKHESAVEYEQRLLQLSADLDRVDITYTPYDAMREYWSWNLLEFLPSTKPSMTKVGLSMTRRPNLYKSRAAYRPEPPHPVAIHASVVDYIASSDIGAYAPRARWRGYAHEELPLIADDVRGCTCWPTKAIDAMKMDWKKLGWRQWAKSQMPMLAGGAKECINNYSKVKPLKGAVPDAQAMSHYLRDYLDTPSDHITKLYNEQATRAAIIQAFSNLRDDKRIKKHDAILIFYAGHGCEVQSPADWKIEGQKTHGLVPYNVGTLDTTGRVTEIIPDRTVVSLLQDLAYAKGDNI
ncbi:hypothetical protein FRC06_002373, partial [Ceratobasidium sp. 370]